MEKSLSRRELRQPDEFVAFSQRALDFVRVNARSVAIAAIAAVVVVAGVWLWAHYSRQNAAALTSELSDVLDRYQQPLTPGIEPHTDGDADTHYASEAQRFAATTTELNQIIAKHGEGSLGGIALLLRAGAYYDAGKFNEAIADYKQFLSQNPTDDLKRHALVGLAHAHEELKQWTEAAQTFGQLEATGGGKVVQDEARFHKARLLAKQGKKDEALKELRVLLNDANDPNLKSRIDQQILALEG